MSAKALIVLADGFEDVEAVAAIDVLRRGGVEVVTASLSGKREVRSAHGVTMLADASFADVSGETYDAIVLPGGGEGTQNLISSQALLERLRRQKDDGGLLCAICAAPTARPRPRAGMRCVAARGAAGMTRRRMCRRLK